MLEFKNPKMEDIEAIQKFLLAEPELSCETNFANLIIWHDYYNTVYYYDDKTLFFRMWEDGDYIFSIPYGDLSYGIELIRQYCKLYNYELRLWACEGERFEKLKK